MINALKGRPLSFFCFSFVIFLCFSYRLSLKQDLIIGTYLIIATGVLTVLALAVKSKRFRALLLLIPITLGSTLGIFWGYSYSQNVLSRTGDLYEKNVCVSARIEKVIYENEYSSAYKVRVTDIDGERSNITAK